LRISGSGTFSTRISFLPWKQTAFISFAPYHHEKRRVIAITRCEASPNVQGTKRRNLRRPSLKGGRRTEPTVLS
jgi:hypothetical protein